MKACLITGGAGFIGSNFARMMVGRYPETHWVVLDKLTYAGRKENLSGIEKKSNFSFVRGDIVDTKQVERLFEEYRFENIFNFAAETHVDRSIESPGQFIMTDVYGAYVLLEAARKYEVKKFIQISTDEVYGSINEGSFSESSPLMPRNPYSASKAGAERLAYSYFATYQINVIITRASNNYGPYQYPEKLIPLFITNAIEGMDLPLYGDGKNIRDWIYVEDHVDALDVVLKYGKSGEVYNIGAGQELENRDVAQMICQQLEIDPTHIKSVKDRLGHDRRYSLNFDKMKALGWNPKKDFQTGLAETVSWYRDNQEWWKRIKSGEYKEYYQRMYGQRR